MVAENSRARYQVVLVGGTSAQHTALKEAIEKRASEMQLPGDVLAIVPETLYSHDSTKLPTLAIVFGGAGVKSSALIEKLLTQSNVVIPVVSDLDRVHVDIPVELRHINAVQLDEELAGLPRLASLVFETFRLLRRERKLFISYRRKESQALADKLYDRLDAAGFDVFIDVRSVPPAVDFQAELWHRMGDSDVVLLIDTPGFRESRWTTLELAQANLTNIQILHLLWPGQAPDPESSMSTFLILTERDFRNGQKGKAGSVLKSTIDRICARTEELRSQAVVWRHRYLVDTFCDYARDLGFEVVVQPQGWILVRGRKGKTFAVIPTIGRPTSDRLMEIFDSVDRSQFEPRSHWVIYDSRGILDAWKKHLDWLDRHLPLRTLHVTAACKELEGYAK
ncbi:hypothetical protein GCM10010520_51360 [Rhizobium viscosum]|uniref:TIR domain-containing protein n=1 Tax=Rhizobium viscosum TaxID=1673 RepID=A0ABR9IZA0_RHIVS|nr:toll/interleukin-1 receptor domain-containing protein [Rhizobium viscosum]MBE1508547.1 hypothetical protein [Rhizobium viscosum]